jgi:hypothetical protein
MKTVIILIAFPLLCISCATVEPSITHRLTYELRIPTVDNPPHASIDFFDGGAACGSGTTHCKVKTEGRYTIYSDDLLILSRVSYRFLFVTPDKDVLVQYFRVAVPEKPNTQDWTQWASPAFVAYDTGNSYGPLFASGKKRRMSTIPAVHFELRYKVEPHEGY